MDRFYSLLSMAERFRYMDMHSQIMFGMLVLTAVVGVMNCILGYRLLRFWMMLGGILIGAILGYFIIDSMGTASQNLYVFGTAGCGIVFGVFTFFVYRAGIFAVGAVAGFAGSFYLLHPMAYSTLFVCLLFGTGLGILTLKFSRGVVICITSVVGGSLIGFAGAKLAGLSELPYGIVIGFAAMLLGLLIQFATNKTTIDLDEEQDVEDVFTKTKEIEK